MSQSGRNLEWQYEEAFAGWKRTAQACVDYFFFGGSFWALGVGHTLGFEGKEATLYRFILL